MICGDLLHMFKNFTCLSNREVLTSNNPMFKLYGSLDMFQDQMSAHDYSQLVRTAIEPGKLNIIEGGSGFYLYFLKTMFLKDFEDVRTLYMYYDHKFCGKMTTQRVEYLMLMGMFEEYARYKQ